MIRAYQKVLHHTEASLIFTAVEDSETSQSFEYLNL